MWYKTWSVEQREEHLEAKRRHEPQRLKQASSSQETVFKSRKVGILCEHRLLQVETGNTVQLGTMEESLKGLEGYLWSWCNASVFHFYWFPSMAGIKSERW